jgi:hypothetical protein
MAEPKKSCEMLCGCHVASKQIVFCRHHASAGKYAALLGAVRNYFLKYTEAGEESPFVKRIDELIPRR